MRVGEWPLISFTLLGQLGAGMFVVALVLRTYSIRTDREGAVRLTSQALFWTGPVVFLAMLASLLHLGSPLGAIRAYRNFGASWLSREVVLTALFFLAWAIGAWLESRRMKEGGPAAWHWVTAILGLASVFAMSQVYSNSIVMAWRSFFTSVSFFAAALLLGALAVAAFAAASLKSKGGSKNVLVITGFLAAAAVGVQMLTTPLYLSLLGSGAAVQQATLHLLTGSFAAAMGARLGLAVLTGGVLGLFIWWQAMRKDAPVSPALVYVALATATVAETLGRFLFYATGSPLGPG